MAQHRTVTRMSSRSAEVCVAQGFGIRIRVERGHLVVDDGIGRDRRTRRYARATHGLSRLVVIGTEGYTTLEAMGWLRTLGIGYVHVSRDGRVISAGERGSGDPKLRRAQALAGANETAIELTRWLLGEKLAGQRSVLKRPLRAGGGLAAFDLATSELETAGSLEELRLLEARAASCYWAALAELPVRFKPGDLKLIPDHWQHVGPRRSPISGRSRHAASPAHALWNLAYTLGENEARLALLALGLDPLLGFSHVDQQGRSSLALDLLEPLRPQIDRYIVQLLRVRTFTRKDFHETRDGCCRLHPDLLEELARTAPVWARLAAPLAEQLAQRIADNTGGGRVSTNLTGANRRAGRARVHGRESRAPGIPRIQPAGSCRRCANPTPVGQTVCAECELAQDAEVIHRASRSGEAAVDRPRKRIDERHEERRAWETEHGKISDRSALLQAFSKDVLPSLATATVAELHLATGLSRGYLRLVRSGQATPHPRHWAALLAVTRTANPRSGCC
jgi:CRISPR/Cas system-associated endonuclease Cas1